MKKAIITAVFAAAVLGLTACSTTTSRTGYKMAEQGQTVLTYPAQVSDANAAKIAMVSALKARGWNVSSAEYPIVATINNRGQIARLSITYTNGTFNIQTKGSTIDGTAYVPLRYVDYLMKTYSKIAR